MRLLFVLLVAPALAVPAPAQSNSSDDAAPDTTAERSDRASWLLLPFASYAPDTKIAVGGVVGYYRSAPAGRSPSSVQATFTVTQRRQIVVQLNPELYLDANRWRLQGEWTISKFPNAFYGIGGETPATAEEPHTDRYSQIDLVLQRRVAPNLRLGPRLFGRIGTTESTAGPDEPNRIRQGLVTGAEGGTTLGAGLSALWDTRDNLYYPTTGSRAAVSALWHSATWGSDYSFGRMRTDLRAYHPLGPGTLAGQLYTDAVAGTTPFQLLPLLGGSDRMRGYREGRFRDNVYWTAQTEYRFPLFWRFGATTFASAGEVGPRLGRSLITGIETAVGVGGRFRFTEDGLHGRLDLAYSPTGLEVYVSLGEAF